MQKMAELVRKTSGEKLLSELDTIIDVMEVKMKDYQRLSSMVSQIYQAGLITTEQKNKMEEMTHPNEIIAEIFELLMTMESVNASTMFLMLRSIEKYGNSLTHDKVVHPLQTETIVRNIYRYLSLEDIKNCRLLNKKWKAESESILRKRSRIVLHGRNKTPTEFQETFPPNKTIPFNSFVFLKCKWPIVKFEQFFEQQGPNVKELEMRSIKLMNENNEKVENYDISHWIAAAPIKILKLVPRMNLSVSFKLLSSIKYLMLHHVKVNIPDQIENRISPVDIKLTNVSFCQDGNKLNAFRINDAVDFSNAEEIHISTSNESTHLTLDLAESFDVRILNLSQVMVINWTTSHCSADFVVLESINFLEKTAMKIKKFIFDGETIDFYGLPPTVEKLSLRNSSAEYLTSEPVVLPNLTSLLLKLDKEYDLEVLAVFDGCNNLTRLIVMNDDLSMEESGSFDLDWIPFTITHMTMKNIDRIHGEDLEIEELTLDNYSLSLATKFLSKISPTKLILIWNPEYEVNESIVKFIELFHHIIIFIGPITWREGEFETNRLANYVDKMANQYVFENKKGRAVDFHYFQNLTKDCYNEWRHIPSNP